MLAFHSLPTSLFAFFLWGIAYGSAIEYPDIYRDAKATELGCICKSDCQTSLAFGCFSQGVCEVEDRACPRGEASWSWSKLGYYDYCSYPKYEPYESKSASEKDRILKSHIYSDESSGTFPSASGLARIFTSSVRFSFNAIADVFPSGTRKYHKFIHSVGAVAAVSFVPSGSNPEGYTGLLSGAGAKFGLLRLSAATEPSSESGMAVGSAMKFFRSGMPSVNFPAMPGLDAQQCEGSTTKFFAQPFTTSLPFPRRHDIGGELLKRKFWQASFCPLQVGISDLATHTQDGTKVVHPKAPYALSFESDIEIEMECDHYEESLRKFDKIEVGTRIFTVKACASPAKCKQPYGDGNGFDIIGSIVITHAFRPSKFGDNELFFRHQLKEADFALRPEWLDEVDLAADCGMMCASEKPPSATDGCSNPFDSSKTTDAGGLEEKSSFEIIRNKMMQLTACPFHVLGIDDDAGPSRGGGEGGGKGGGSGCPFATMWQDVKQVT